MGKIDPKRIPKTMQLFQKDLPVLICSIGAIEDTDEYWAEVIQQCHAVYEKYNNELAKKMVMAIAEYLDEQSKKVKK